MRPGAVVKMTSCAVVDGGMRAGFRPPEGSPRGTTMAFVFLGNVKPGEAFDPIAALRALGFERKDAP